MEDESITNGQCDQYIHHVEPPVNDCGELLLGRDILIALKALYGVTRRTQEPFVSKHLNIVDPLCENNNLGRSISMGI
ncbi:unnamed protein product [Lupinus luteus]|uniref:PAP/OAS1 substrate-binding-related domain-containing protein n=1 Tax=Lupinus luteus TaxID=3873 RepID=A0AAV1Y0T1_LUPLU